MPALAALGLSATMVLHAMMPSMTTLPPDPALAPRKSRSPTVTVVPTYPVLLDRPLFTPTRQFASAAPEAQAGNANLAGYVVVGIAKARGFAQATARGPDGTVRSLRTGDDLIGWRVSRIGRDEVAFVRETETRVIPVSADAPLTASESFGRQELSE
jgi:hypothetical protein